MSGQNRKVGQCQDYLQTQTEGHQDDTCKDNVTGGFKPWLEVQNMWALYQGLKFQHAGPIKLQSPWELLLTGRPGCSHLGRVEMDLVSSKQEVIDLSRPGEMTLGK